MDDLLTPERALPADRKVATLVGRCWVPGPHAGPSVVVVRGDDVIDISRTAPTVSELLNGDDPAATARSADGQTIGSIGDILANSQAGSIDATAPHLLAPCDLQALKAAGVTFVKSMLERVIEEQARGDADKALEIRERVVGIIGNDLRAVQPGSERAAQLKAALIEQGAWSQYLEVGIGPDAEVFTKAPAMAGVGTGADIGLHPRSTWNNPEPEIVLAINAGGKIVGASLGNDVNLRDFEGRSALLLGKAKDNNGSCAIGPFIRLFDAHYGIEQVRVSNINLNVRGKDGFELNATSSMSEISRDPEDLVRHTYGGNHQYPDGAMLMCGTMFAPVEDRGEAGRGFTHKQGDIVTVASTDLGALVNRVGMSNAIEPWTFGAGALMRNLAARGLI